MEDVEDGGCIEFERMNGVNKIRKLMVVALGLWAGAASAATGKSAAFPLDLIEGDRVSAGTEELTFSNLWDGDAEATVTIAQDGAAIFTGVTAKGIARGT